ncbi:MAG TPA: carbohydrate binding domain-containing protein, partial [Chitinivibrionales bacterium]
MTQSIRLGKMAVVGAVVLLMTILNCGIQLRPLKSTAVKAEVVKSPSANDKVVYRFFDEEFVSGGYSYNYPEASRVFIPEESGHESEVALQFDLEAGDYSGGAVCLYNLLYDVTPYYGTGALQFWIKGNEGGEIAWIALVDDEKSDGKKTVVRLPCNNYGGISREWHQVSIPLADFGKRGVYWDEKKRVEVPNKFDWDQVAEFRMEIKKADNKKFRVWIDDIFICKDTFQPRPEKKEEYWDDQVETIASPSLPEKSIKPVKTLFKNSLPGGAFAYVYGGKTAYKVQKGTSPEYSGILACYEDNGEYSGVTVALGKGNSYNLESLRKSKAAGLAFWAKGAPGVSSVYVGLLDLEPEDKKVQTKLTLGDFGKLDTSWHYFMVPLRRFQDKGKYWDANKKAEIVADVDWKSINEIRFSVNKAENKVEEGKPVCLYVEDMAFIDAIPGYVDPDEYWASFKSSEPDMVLHDFETAEDAQWDVAKGPKSEVKYEMVKATEKNGGQKAMSISYKLNDWCDVMYDYSVHKTPPKKRDWTKYWGIKFNFYTDKAYQPINVQVSDAGNEIFIASSGRERGWNEVIVPFKAFYKFPYW